MIFKIFSNNCKETAEVIKELINKLPSSQSTKSKDKIIQNLEKEEEQLDLELEKIKKELDRLKSNTAFVNLQKLLDETKSALKEIESIQLETDSASQMRLWELLSMRIPQTKYMSIKLQNYQENNTRLEKLYKQKKAELKKYLTAFEGSEQKRRFLESEIEALKKIEKLKDRFFYILMMENKNSKETYREKILKESLREKMEGKVTRKSANPKGRGRL